MTGSTWTPRRAVLSGPLGEYGAGLRCRAARTMRFKPMSADHQLRLLAHLSGWMQNHGLGARQTDRGAGRRVPSGTLCHLYRVVLPAGAASAAGSPSRAGSAPAEEFREGAVRIVEKTNKPIAQVARDLGVNEGTLGNWVNRAREEAEGTRGLSKDDREELKRLRGEVAELRMERDVLKRSVVLWVKEATK